ncbi:MAG: DNA cytosine methyltransferase, partial [Ruminiclostridium sp.]|nr:DNA cytosine methyltransferase [Ruminiclostridium sp.]
EPNEPMFTITAQDRHGILHKGYIRRLTPLECWRLQGFEDDQFYLAYTTTQANTHLYRMAGNSVTVPVITAIAKKIKAAAEMIGLDTT